MLNARATGFYAILAGAVLAAGGSAAQGSMSFTVAADNSSQQTIYAGSPPTTTTGSVGPLYTLFGSPSVVTAGTTTTYNFNAVLSPAFGAQADGFVVLKQTTDGHLVMNLHFDNAVSLVATVNEGGVYNQTAPGFVQVGGGEVAVEAVNPSATETHASALTTVLDPSSGGWTGTATTTAFTGFFTDYQLLIDNDLIAVAPSGGSADIFKKTFTIDITTTGSGSPPPVPEPASLGLLGLGAVGLLMRRRK